MRCSRCSFSEVNCLIIAVLIADEDETAAANAGMIAADDTNTEDGADKGVNGISLCLKSACERMVSQEAW
jgi:hypothetical protein